VPGAVRRLSWAGIAGLAALACGAGTLAAVRPATRLRLARSSRLWRLTVRRGAAYATHAVRRRGADAAEREALDRQFTIRTANDVARELGHMKGAVMKAGQLISFIVEALPDEAQAALATLQAEAPPMAPSLAEATVAEELGRHPAKLFAHWEPVPAAAASIGQVHRARLHDGREVAVKVQYPGIGDAIGADLDNAELLYGLFSALALKGLDVHAMVAELRARMIDELDYRLEAANQRAFCRMYEGHPFIRIPNVVDELSTGRVLVSEWVEGMPWSRFEAEASPADKQVAAEVLFRFAQQSVYRHQVFNGDPHPGNYRFHHDGTVTFLDFGLVKKWTAAEIAALWPVIDPLLAGDPARTVREMVTAGFLPPDHGLDPADVYAYVSAPYVPFLSEEFTFNRRFVADALGKIIDVKGPHQAVIERLNLPTSFVILDRVVWGMSALLGKLDARNHWRAILDEYRLGGPPATPLGEIEARWRERRAS
jgi:predicted unusual protein kinase regulating ubiquinone biosynthesis (AarF/ABC1/UbiB family)